MGSFVKLTEDEKKSAEYIVARSQSGGGQIVSIGNESLAQTQSKPMSRPVVSPAAAVANLPVVESPYQKGVYAHPLNGSRVTKQQLEDELAFTNKQRQRMAEQGAMLTGDAYYAYQEQAQKKSQEAAQLGAALASITRQERAESAGKQEQEYSARKESPNAKYFVEQGKGSKDNVVEESRANWEKIAYDEAHGIQSNKRSIYRHMTDDQVQTYNYILGKDGKDAANAYLANIEEQLSQKEGKAQAQHIENMGGLGEKVSKGVYAMAAGSSNAMEGARQAFRASIAGNIDRPEWKEKYQNLDAALPTGAMQYGSQEIRKNLGGFKGFAYDLAFQVGNMLPSIVLSMGVGGGAAGKALASTYTGVSAKGNAYNEAIKEGYSKEQARTYSTLIGASEGILQYLLSGIGKLGGVADDVLLAKVKGIDNALAKLALTGLIRGGGEIAEEELQLLIEPTLRSLILNEEYNAPTWEEVAYTALLSAATVGAMEGVPAAGGKIKSTGLDIYNKTVDSIKNKRNPQPLTPATGNEAQATTDSAATNEPQSAEFEPQNAPQETPQNAPQTAPVAQQEISAIEKFAAERQSARATQGEADYRKNRAEFATTEEYKADLEKRKADAEYNYKWAEGNEITRSLKVLEAIKAEESAFLSDTNAQSQAAKAPASTNSVGAMANQYKSGQAVSKAKSPWEAGQEVSQEERLYDVTSDEERLAVARQRLDLDYEGEAKYLRETNEWNGEDINVAHMIQSDLFAEAQKTGDFTKFRDWQKMVKRQSSNFGANLQMLKHWVKRDAQTITSDAASILDEAKEAAAANGKKVISDETIDSVLQDIADYSAKAENLEKANDMEGIYDLVLDVAKHRGYNPSKAVRNALKTCTMEELQDVMWAEINGIAIDAIPSSLGRKLSTYQYLAQLLNAKTLLRNITSNSILAPVESLFTNNIAAVVDMVASSVVGKTQGITMRQARTVGFETPFSKEKRAGRKKGAQQSAIDVELDISRGTSSNKYEVNTNRTFNRYTGDGWWTKIKNIPNALEGVLGYGLNVTDEMQKGATDASVRKSLDKLANTEGSRLTKEMVDKMAENEQLYRSVQRDTLIGEWLQGGKDWLNVIGFGTSNGKTVGKKKLAVKDFGLGDFVNKYSKVPGAIATTLMEYTDLGYAKAIYNLYAMAYSNTQINKGRGGAEIKSGLSAYKGMTNEQAAVYAQRAFAQNIARVLTGKGLMAAFTGLAKLGVLVFTDDEDKDEAAVKRTQGLSGLQINLSALGRLLDGESAEKQHDDVLADINSIEPINGLAQIGAELAAMEDDATRAEKFNATAQAVVDSFTDLSMMQNVGTIVDNFTYRGDEETWGETITKSGLGLLTNSVSGLVPAPIRQAAQFFDPYYRDAYSGTEQERLANAVKNPIPGLRQQLPTSITPLGEERKKTTSGALDFFSSFISPFNITRYQQSDVVDEMERSGVYVSRSSPKTLTKDGVETELTAEQRRQHQISKGSAMNMAVSGLMGSASFKNASEKDRNEMMADARSYANEVAKASVVGDKAADGWVIRARDSGMPEAYIQYRHFADGKSSQADVAKALQKVQGISDQQRGKIWSAEKNKDGKESTEAKNPFTGAMPEAGISSSTAVDILAEYSKIDKSDLKDRDKPAEFRKYVRTLGLDPKQMRVVGDIFPYFGSYPIYW